MGGLVFFLSLILVEGWRLIHQRLNHSPMGVERWGGGLVFFCCVGGGSLVSLTYGGRFQIQTMIQYRNRLLCRLERG